MDRNFFLFHLGERRHHLYCIGSRNVRCHLTEIQHDASCVYATGQARAAMPRTCFARVLTSGSDERDRRSTLSRVLTPVSNWPKSV